VCHTVRDDARSKGIKILAISGYDAEEYREKALEAGADDFLAKPFTANEMTRKLEKMLSGTNGS
ncbi:MAG: response regulator, partial [Elusimicrobia bacterium]|nr:response regulator [Elusimicrobiota bacterium]